MFHGHQSISPSTVTTLGFSDVGGCSTDQNLNIMLSYYE